MRTQGAAALQQALDTAIPLAHFGIEQIIRELAGERKPSALEPALKAQIVERGLEWVQSLPSALDRLACLEQLAPLTPAYLTNPQTALQTLQHELQRRLRPRRRAQAAAPQFAETPPPPERPAIPKAVFQAESEVLRATLYPESAAVALEHLPTLEWQVPLHAQLAAAILALPRPPYHYENPAELLRHVPDEPLQHLLTALLMQESPPMTEAWASGCIQRLKEYTQRRSERRSSPNSSNTPPPKPSRKRREVAGILAYARRI